MKISFKNNTYWVSKYEIIFIFNKLWFFKFEWRGFLGVRFKYESKGGGIFMSSYKNELTMYVLILRSG